MYIHVSREYCILQNHICVYSCISYSIYRTFMNIIYTMYACNGIPTRCRDCRNDIFPWGSGAFIIWTWCGLRPFLLNSQRPKPMGPHKALRNGCCTCVWIWTQNIRASSERERTFSFFLKYPMRLLILVTIFNVSTSTHTSYIHLLISKAKATLTYMWYIGLNISQYLKCPLEQLSRSLYTLVELQRQSKVGHGQPSKAFEKPSYPVGVSESVVYPQWPLIIPGYLNHPQKKPKFLTRTWMMKHQILGIPYFQSNQHPKN